MVDLNEFLATVPLTLTEEERKEVQEVAAGLGSAAVREMPCVLMVSPDRAQVFQIVLAAGIRAIDEGLITFDDPPKL